MAENRSPSPQFPDAFTARDVKGAAGLSYRQLSDWESKGTFGSRREVKEGWRKFSAREVFALMVCAEIRRQFGVPVESLASVNSSVLDSGAGKFNTSIQAVMGGGTVWLLTDLRKTFLMKSANEMKDFIQGGSANSQGVILLPINSLVLRLMKFQKSQTDAGNANHKKPKTNVKNPRGAGNRGRVRTIAV